MCYSTPERSVSTDTPLPDSMMEAFPAASGMTATEDGAPEPLREALANPWAAADTAAAQR